MNNMNKVDGKIVEIQDEQTFAGGFVKRVVIADTSKNPGYPSPVPFTFKKNDAELVKGLHVGDKVTLDFFVEGRKWDGPNGTKYFVDLAVKGVLVTEAAKVETAPSVAENWSDFQNIGSLLGVTEDELKQRGKEYCTKSGKAFKDLTKDDWAAMSKSLTDDHGVTVKAVEPDLGDYDMPF